MRDALSHGGAAARRRAERRAEQPPRPSPEQDRIISASAFEILPLAAALDYAIALAPLLTSAAEQTLKLLDRPWSGLATGLAPKPSTVESGLSHYAITAGVAAEARLLAHPVSFKVVSTTGAEGIEDRITMAPLGARRLDMVGLGERLLAIQLLIAAQAVELRGDVLSAGERADCWNSPGGASPSWGTVTGCRRTSSRCASSSAPASSRGSWRRRTWARHGTGPRESLSRTASPAR